MQSYKNNTAPAEQNPAVVAFLEKVSRAAVYPEESQAYQNLAGEGASLIDAGCKDPLVRLWYGQMLFRAKEMEKAEPQLMIAYEWDDNRYPDIHGFLALRSLALISHRKRGNRPREATNHTGYALDRFCGSIVSKNFADSEVHIAFRMLKETYSDSSALPKFTFVLNALEGYDGVNPWLKSMIRGNSEIELTWEARGTGWSKDVMPENRERFGQHLDRAAKILTAAWQSDPKRPEAAGNMITVTMGGHGNEGETIRTWFDRAVTAQMDYPDAYESMANALRPRWGGSHREMLAFGRQCLGTNRFDTDVPLFYLYALRDIGVEIENNRWRLPFRDGRVKKELQGMFEGLLSEPSRSQSSMRIKTQQALVSAWCGDYPIARQQLEAAGSGIDFGDGFLGKALSWSKRSRATVESELQAFTGPNREDLIQAENLELSNRIPEALALYEKAMQAHGMDTGIFGYLRDRMARLKLGETAEYSADPPLVLAVNNDALEAAAFLLDNGADVNVEDFYYKTPLHHAAADNRMQMAELLIRHGASPGKRAFGLATPLHLAIRNHHSGMALFLIDHGADVTVRDSGGWSPLHFALYYDQPELAAMCIHKGADIQAKSEGGWSPMHHAAKHGCADVVRMLVAKGARMEDRTDCGWTP